MPLLQQGFGLVIPGLRGVQKCRRGVAIHHHFAGDHAQTTPLGLREKHIHRMGMHSAIHHRRGGANTQTLIEKQR